MILKPLGAEISIASANTVANSMLVRVINTGASAVLHLANTGGEYANLTVSNAQYVVIQKQTTDTLTGANMLATPVAYKY
jgi:hypothetical protein